MPTTVYSALKENMASTHDEAIVAAVLAVKEAAAGLEEEQARLGVVVVGRDPKSS